VTPFQSGLLSCTLPLVGFVILVGVLLAILSVFLLLFDLRMGLQGLAVSLTLFFGGKTLLGVIEKKLDAIETRLGGS